jgi:hypothetical protein
MKINSKIPLWSLYLKNSKEQYMYSSIEGSEDVLVLERNNAGLKKLSEQTVDSSAFLNVMCLFEVMYSTVNSIFSCFDPD